MKFGLLSLIYETVSPFLFKEEEHRRLMETDLARVQPSVLDSPTHSDLTCIATARNSGLKLSCFVELWHVGTKLFMNLKHQMKVISRVV